MDIFLKIWAIVGPLLAATASAIWARRVQLQDRRHEDQRAQTSRLHTIDDGRISHLRATRTAARSELRSAASDFISALHEYALCATTAMRDDASDAASDAFVEARRNLNITYGKLVVLGDDELSRIATEAIGAAVALPPTSSDGGKFNDQATQRFLSAKESLISQTKLAIRSLDEA